MPKLCHSKCWRRLEHIFKLPKELTLLVQKDTDYVQSLKKHKNIEMIHREPISTIPASQVQNTSSKDYKTLKSRNQAWLPLASWSPASLTPGRKQTLNECVLKKWTASEWVSEWASESEWVWVSELTNEMNLQRRKSLHGFWSKVLSPHVLKRGISFVTSTIASLVSKRAVQ